jgi:hypothetical protein
MAKAPTTAVPLDPLTELQKSFCIIDIAGEIRYADRRQIAGVLNGSNTTDVGLYKKPDADWKMQRELETYPVSCKAKMIIDQFRVDPKTLVYDAIAFSPHPLPPTTLNYWSPSPIVPIKGDWNPIAKFLRNVICARDQTLFLYLVCFLAHMLQKPGEKPGIMLVFLGGEGVGKGTFFQLLRSIWPRTTLQVADIDHVTGGFNAVLERKYIVCMDEAIFSGDRKALDRLKSLVTEPRITIEQKFQPRREIESCHRFFAASNHDHFASVATDDRRFVFFRVPDHRKGDHLYFSAVHAAVNDPDVIAAMVHALQNLDISSFNVRQRPKTAAHTDQKLRSLTGFDRYWADVLKTADLSAGAPDTIPKDWTVGTFVSTKKLRVGCKAHHTHTRNFATLRDFDVNGALRKWCPSAVYGRPLINGVQERGYHLPSLAEARQSFEHAIGGKVDWGDDTEVSDE